MTLAAGTIHKLLLLGSVLVPWPAMALDLALIHGRIYTADPTRPEAEAVAIEDGRFVRVGTDREVRSLVGPETEVIDLGGRRVLPGLIDTHSHAVFAGLELAAASMGDEVVPVEELSDRIKGWRAEGRTGRDGVVSIFGMNSAYWSRIDALSSVFDEGTWADVPLVLIGSDYHTAWANRAMLARAELDAAALDALPENERGGIGLRSDGTPNGFVVDAGWDRVAASLPSTSPDELRAGAEAAVRYNNSVGITAWMDPAANAMPGDALFDANPQDRSVGCLPAYRALSEEGRLTAHVAALLLANPRSTSEDLAALAEVAGRFEGVENLSFPGIKVFADGVLEYPAQTAALLGTYSNSGQSGELLLDPASFGQLVHAANDRGWLVHVHAIGDRAVRAALDGFEQGQPGTGPHAPNSITHLQLVHPADVPRFRQLDVLASMQLLWATADSYTVDMVEPHVDAATYDTLYPAARIHRSGGTVVGASDWPVSPPDPFLIIHQAMTREGPHGVLGPDEVLDLRTMLQAYTRDAARALGLEDEIGTIEAGKSADLIVLDRDVLSIPVEDIAETRVLRTIFRGRTAHMAEP